MLLGEEVPDCCQVRVGEVDHGEVQAGPIMVLASCSQVVAQVRSAAVPVAAGGAGP